MTLFHYALLFFSRSTHSTPCLERWAERSKSRTCPSIEATWNLFSLSTKKLWNAWNCNWAVRNDWNDLLLNTQLCFMQFLCKKLSTKSCCNILIIDNTVRIHIHKIINRFSTEQIYSIHIHRLVAAIENNTNDNFVYIHRPQNFTQH